MTRVDTLSIVIEISPEVPLAPSSLRDLAVYVGRYVAQLCRDLGLPGDVSATVTPADAAFQLPSQFRLIINGDVCPSRLWPHVPLNDLPVRELATILSEAIHHSRVSLLTPVHVEVLAQNWNVQLEGKYLGGWTVELFHGYLQQFVQRNFSVSRAKGSVHMLLQETAADRNVELMFEECLEDSENLRVGLGLRVGCSQLTEGPELAAVMTQLCRSIALDPGVPLPAVMTTVDDDLDDNDFCIQINDVLLPPARGVPVTRKIATAANDALVIAGIPSQPIVDPIAGTVCRLVEISDESSAKLRSAGIQLLEQTSAAYIRWSVAAAVRLNAGSLLAAPIVHFLLDRVKRDSPGLVSQAQSLLETLSPPPGRMRALRWTITAILRFLLDEQVTIRDFDAVLESFLYLRVLRGSDGTRRVVSFRTPVSIFQVTEHSSLNELSIAELAQGTRFCLRSLTLRYGKVTDQGTVLFPLVFSQQIQQRLAEHAACPLTPLEKRALHQAVWDQVARFGIDDNTSILTDQIWRTTVRGLLAVEFPTIGIIGINEIARTFKDISPAGVIDWPTVTAQSGPESAE